MATPARIGSIPGEGALAGKLGPLSSPQAAPPGLRAGDTGRMFAREVERALERSHGQGPEARRAEELAGERRAVRRAGFGAERGEESEAARPTEAVFRPEHAPASAQPAAALRAAEELDVPAAPPPEAAPSAPPAPAEGAPAVEAPDSAAGTTLAPAQGQVQASAHRASETFAAGGRTRTEPPPLEPPPVARAAVERGARPALAPEAAAGPEAPVLARAEEILRQIRLHATPNVQRLTLELEPADLGRLSIQLALRTGKVTAIVRAESARTLELLERREDDLLTLLSERGIRADSVRFEHGFGAPRATRDDSRPIEPPRGPAARLDTHA
jgi:flagellar hook-length control protein FliK